MKHPDKGNYGLECYREVCKNTPATWYNHSTKMYYCEECAALLNRMNYKDALDMFGHCLCTPGNHEPKE